MSNNDNEYQFPISDFVEEYDAMTEIISLLRSRLPNINEIVDDVFDGENVFSLDKEITRGDIKARFLKHMNK